HFGGLDTLAVDNAGAGLRPPALLFADAPVQRVLDLLPDPALAPAIKLGRNGAPGGQVVGEQAPLAAAAQDVEDSVEDVALFHAARTAGLASFALRQQVPDKVPLGIR